LAFRNIERSSDENLVEDLWFSHDFRFISILVLCLHMCDTGERVPALSPESKPWITTTRFNQKHWQRIGDNWW